MAVQVPARALVRGGPLDEKPMRGLVQVPERKKSCYTYKYRTILFSYNFFFALGKVY